MSSGTDPVAQDEVVDNRRMAGNVDAVLTKTEHRMGIVWQRLV